MAKSQYRKVATATQSLFFRNSLHLADDHLLMCKSSGFTRDFQRFFYADIQAMTLQANELKRGSIIGTIGLMVLSMGLLFNTSSDFLEFFSWVTLVLSGFVLIYMVRKGTGCKVVIETYAQATVLPALIRKRKALKVMDLVRERVEAVQGTLSDESLQIQDQAPPARRPTSASREAARATRWHWGHFAAWLGLAFLLSLTFSFNFNSLTIGVLWGLPLLIFLLGLLGIASNIRLRRMRTPLEVLTYFSLFLVMVHGVVLYFYLSFQLVALGYATSGLAIYTAFLDGAIYNQPVFFQYRNGLVVVALLLGAAGMGMCMARNAANHEWQP